MVTRLAAWSCWVKSVALQRFNIEHVAAWNSASCLIVLMLCYNFLEEVAVTVLLSALPGHGDSIEARDGIN